MTGLLFCSAASFLQICRRSVKELKGGTSFPEANAASLDSVVQIKWVGRAVMVETSCAVQRKPHSGVEAILEALFNITS
jgi:hypothetical protein